MALNKYCWIISGTLQQDVQAKHLFDLFIFLNIFTVSAHFLMCVCVCVGGIVVCHFWGQMPELTNVWPRTEAET